MRTKILTASILLLTVHAAAQEPASPPEQPGAPRSAVTKERDDFKKVTWYRGREAPAHKYDTVILRAYKHDRLPTRYQIYVSDHYENGWRFYDTAHDINGQRLNLIEISREVGVCDQRGCSHYEDVAISVSRGYLEANSKSGIKFQISGRGGKEVFTLPAEHIAEMLDATTE